VANTIEIEITAQDTSESTITKANANLDKMAQELLNVQQGLQQLDWSRAFKDASRIDVAGAALDDLRKKLDSGAISFDDYQAAVQKTQRALDMATPESEQLAQKITQLNQDFSDGKVDADAYARELDQLTKNQDALARKSKEASSGMKLMDGVMMSLGSKAVEFVSQLPRMTIELAKFGAEVEQQKIATNALAESFGTSGNAIVSAIQEASQYTISQMGAMQSANRAMILDVANTPEMFARLTKVATTLGKAMGQDAAKSIDDFVVAAGRQSKQIADNLGLMVSAEDANVRYAASIGKTADQLTDAEKKQAFLTEMLRQGEAKMSALGEASDTASVKIAKVTAALEDAKAGVSEVLVESLSEAVGGVDELSERLRLLPDTIKNLSVLGKAFLEAQLALKTLKNPMDAFNQSLKEQTGYYDDVDTEIAHYSKNVADLKDEIGRYAKGQDKATKSTDDFGDATKKVAEIGASTQMIIDKYFETLDEPDWNTAVVEGSHDIVTAMGEVEKKAQETARAFKLATDTMVLEQGMAFTDFFKGVQEAAQENSKTIEEIEAEHLANVTDLQKRSQDYMIQIDEAAEQEKLANLQQKLELALLQQSEFTEKTKESTRMSKEAQIAELQAQVSTQTQLLDDYYNGRLIAQGENVSSLLASEEERYNTELALQAEKQAAIEEEQRQSLGRMVLQAFESWAQMKQIPADKMLEMRTALAEEYGLVEAGSTELVKTVVSSWEEWAGGTKTNTDAVVTYVANATDSMLELKRSVEDLPDSKTINVAVKINGRVGAFEDAGLGVGMGFAMGMNDSVPAVAQAAEKVADTAVNSTSAALSIHSPSRKYYDMAVDTVDGFIIGMEDKAKDVEKSVKENIVDPLESAFDISGSFDRVGSTASRMLEEKYLNPLKETAQGVSKDIEDLNKELDKILEQEEQTPESLERQKQIAQELIGLENQRAGITDEIATQEERIAKMKEAQQNLDFLKQQLDLVKMIQETGTDPSILKNFKFGLDASLEDLVDITTTVLEDVGNKVNDEISNIQTDAGFNPFAYLGPGTQDITSRNIEDQLGRFLANIFNDSARTTNNTQNTTSNSATFGDLVFSNNMDIASFGVMLNQFFGQAVLM